MVLDFIIWFSAIHLSLASAEDKLILTQIIWRHGDRSPLITCKGDTNRNPETEWPQGLGQLTVLGMKQQEILGSIIKQRYVDEYKFLSKEYNAWQFYARSTDRNRTLISAMSNFVGFFSDRKSNIPGVAYPNETLWPVGYVPVPIHTVPDQTDHLLNPSSICPRQDWLYKEMWQTPELQELNKTAQPMLSVISSVCAENVDIDLMSKYVNVFYCEKQHNYTLPINQSFFEELIKLDDKLQDYENGLGLKPYNGINFKVEIAKVRGGSILWDIIKHIELKMYCINNTKSAHCKWMNDLKYYAYSAHDSTIAALLSTMDAKEAVVVSGGYPLYTAALFVDLYSTSNGYEIKFSYHRNFTSREIYNVTTKINGCKNVKNELCPFAEFRKAAIPYYPGNIVKLCQDVTTKSTSFNPDGGSVVTTTPKSSSHLTNSMILIIVMLITHRFTDH